MDFQYEMLECRNNNEMITMRKKLKVLSLTTAKVVASRISCRLSVEYKIQIETETHGSFVLWHDYRTFRRFSEQLESKSGYQGSGIAKLPQKQRLPYLKMKDQVTKLNEFLTAAVNADTMRWAIRLDRNTCVVKHRRREDKQDEPRESLASNASTASCTSSTEPPVRARMPRRSRLFYLVRHSNVVSV